MTPYTLYVGLTRSAGGGDFAKLIDRLSGGRGFCHAFMFWPAMGMVWESHIDCGGVRWRDRRPDPNREALYAIPGLDDAKGALILRQMCLLDGKGYDCPGAYHSGEAFGGNWVKQDPEKYFCSEAVVTALQQGGYLTNWTPADISPNELAAVVTGWERANL